MLLIKAHINYHKKARTKRTGFLNKVGAKSSLWCYLLAAGEPFHLKWCSKAETFALPSKAGFLFSTFHSRKLGS